MDVPANDGVLGADWLSEALAGCPRWPYGSVRSALATRIGVDHGLSGRVHRLLADTGSGDTLSFVVKQQTANDVERALLFHNANGETLRGCVPWCFGGITDANADRGVLFLEDISPAQQGDILEGCSNERAYAVIRVLARVHATSWRPADLISEGLPTWRASAWDPARWSDRLSRAEKRFPEILRAPHLARLRDLPERITAGIARLRNLSVAWIHVDAHLDNVLWRPDGTAVLLDWCSAAIGPPAVDLVRFLIEGGGTRGVGPEARTELLNIYTSELRHLGITDGHLSVDQDALVDAFLPMLQGIIGWAGRVEEREPSPRMVALREHALRRAYAWLDAGVGRTG